MVSSIANTNNSIRTQLNCFKYCYLILTIQFNISHLFVDRWLNSSIWPIVGTLTGTTTLDQSGPGSNGNERVLHIP